MNKIDLFYTKNKNKITVVMILLFVFVYFLLRNYNDAKEYKKIHQNNLNELKRKNELIILSKQKSIDSLLSGIKSKDILISKAQKSIDSLSVLKNKVIIKYKDRIIKVDSYSSSQILNYWKDEFSK